MGSQATRFVRPNTRMQADRFAREIVAILAFSYATRSRRLMRKTLDGNQSNIITPNRPERGILSCIPTLEHATHASMPIDWSVPPISIVVAVVYSDFDRAVPHPHEQFESKVASMPVLIEQSWLSGSIHFVRYRHLLDAHLTDERLTVSCLTKQVLDIPVTAILEVKQFKAITMIGLKITYQSKPHLTKVFYLQTTNHQQWADACASLGITVRAPGGWLEFDGTDYFVAEIVWLQRSGLH